MDSSAVEPAPDLAGLPLLTRWLRQAAATGLVGASLGLALWALTHRAQLGPLLAANTMERASRLQLLGSMVGPAGLAVLATLLVLGSNGPYQGMEQVERWSRRLAPLMLTGPVVLLLHWRLWERRDLPFLALTALVVFGARPLIERALETFAPRDDTLARSFAPRSNVPLWMACGSGAFFTAFFGYYTVGNHYNLCTSSFDLGIEHNIVYNTMFEGEFLRTTPLGGSFSHAGYHQTYFTYVIGLFYLLAPYPETLLILQASFVGMAVIPIFLLARRLTGPWIAATLALAYSFYAPVQGGIMYDFHYQPFSVFFIPLVYYSFVSRRNWLLVLSVVLQLSLREDMGLPLAALAVFLALTGQRPLVALTIVLLSAVHFVAFKLVIMPQYLQGNEAYTYMYKDLVAGDIGGFAGVLATILSNPGHLLQTLLTAKKLEYFLLIFAPLAFLPLTRPSGWLLLVPGTLFTFLTTGIPASLMISFQYTAFWTPFVFIGTAWALGSIRGTTRAITAQRRAACMVALGLGMLVTSVRYGYLFQDETTLGAFDPVHFGPTPADRQNHSDLYALLARIGPKDKVVASEWLVSHVSRRRDAYTLRFGTFDAEWLVFWHDLRRDELPHADRALRERTFGVVEQRGKFVLARRGHDGGAENDRVLAWLRAPLPQPSKDVEQTR